jgi:hypothetical protein
MARYLTFSTEGHIGYERQCPVLDCIDIIMSTEGREKRSGTRSRAILYRFQIVLIGGLKVKKVLQRTRKGEVDNNSNLEKP